MTLPLNPKSPDPLYPLHRSCHPACRAAGPFLPQPRLLLSEMQLAEERSNRGKSSSSALRRRPIDRRPAQRPPPRAGRPRRRQTPPSYPFQTPVAPPSCRLFFHLECGSLAAAFLASRSALYWARLKTPACPGVGNQMERIDLNSIWESCRRRLRMARRSR